VVLVTPDAAVPSIVGTPCDDQRACGPELSCDLRLPGGYCSTPCTPAGTACGTGTCVEQPAIDVCRASCQTTADCRADEGYVCDPVWRGCTLANTATIAPRACPAPPGFGRDPLFGPATELANHSPRSPAGVITDEGGLVVLHETHGEANDPPDKLIEMARVDAFGRSLPGGLFPGRGTEPVLVRDGGTLHAVFANHRGAPKVMLASSSDRGTSWGQPITLADTDCRTERDCTSPMIAVGNDPARRGPAIVYVGYASAGGLRIRASRDGGKTFGPPITALAGAKGKLATAANGTLFVVAVRGSPRGAYGSADQDIVLAMSTDGGRSFTRRPQVISRYGETIPFYGATPTVVYDSARRWLYVTYVRGGRDGKWDLAVLATKDLGKTWVRSRIGDDPPCATHFAPAIALDPTTGGLWIAWYDSRGNRFASAICTDGLRLCRQRGRLNDTPFAALSLARHGAAAVGESPVLLVDNLRRTLHAVWSQAVAVDGAPAARIFHAKAKLPLR
jgi:hypothetical protein